MRVRKSVVDSLLRSFAAADSRVPNGLCRRSCSTLKRMRFRHRVAFEIDWCFAGLTFDRADVSRFQVGHGRLMANAGPAPCDYAAKVLCCVDVAESRESAPVAAGLVGCQSDRSATRVAVGSGRHGRHSVAPETIHRYHLYANGRCAFPRVRRFSRHGVESRFPHGCDRDTRDGRVEVSAICNR
jgi:hypothetical protein